MTLPYGTAGFDQQIGGRDVESSRPLLTIFSAKRAAEIRSGLFQLRDGAKEVSGQPIPGTFLPSPDILCLFMELTDSDLGIYRKPRHSLDTEPFEFAHLFSFPYSYKSLLIPSSFLLFHLVFSSTEAS